LGALKQPNVSIKWDAIEGIVKEGIKLETGEVVPLDVIIFGTGFSIARLFHFTLLHPRFDNYNLGTRRSEGPG
jgi:hypothetical protein